jgi:hypothetical protein
VVESTTIRDNSWRGIYALCGATVTIGRSTISGNVGGAEAATSWSLDPTHAASAPVVLDVSDSLFDGNTGANLVVWGKGAVGHGFKNRYEGKDDGTTLYGLHATGGGRYLGQRDSFKGNAHFGVFALGHEVVCATEDCSVLVVDREETLVTLDNATLSGNGYDGVLALCGTTVELRDSASTGNGGSGAVAMSTCDWGDLGLSAAPSRIFARGTLFSENREDGVTAYEDSQLLLGSLADPGRNSFLGNLARSIANSTPNPVLAQWNWFGTSDAAAIASSIVDCRADPSYGCVEHVPFLSRAPRGNGR